MREEKIEKNNVLRIKVDIDNGLKAKKLLANLSDGLSKIEGNLTLDFEEVSFLAANQLAVLGAVCDEFCISSSFEIIFKNLSSKVKDVICKNSFHHKIGLKPKFDKYHTGIPYREFNINDSSEFERYLMIYIFQRNDIPNMTEKVRNAIIDNILEVFNNVKEHTTAKTIYTCGQFFPRSQKLYFTIVDIGETIKENVDNYFNGLEKDMQTEMGRCNSIEWAMEAGNSTRRSESPGGLGFSILKQFIELNQGELSILSDNECYEFKKDKFRVSQLKYRFHGTIVTIAINMRDSFLYLSIDDCIEQIQF